MGIGKFVRDPWNQTVRGVQQVGTELERGAGQIGDAVKGAFAGKISKDPKAYEIDPTLEGQLEKSEGQRKGLATEVAQKQAARNAAANTPQVRSALQGKLGVQQGTLNQQLMNQALGKDPLTGQLVSNAMGGDPLTNTITQRAMGQDALSQQLMQRALGQGPSLAQMATDRAVGQSTAGQQSVIGSQRSARGGIANIARQQAGEAGTRAIANEAGMSQLQEQIQSQALAQQGQIQQGGLAAGTSLGQQQLAVGTVQGQQELASQNLQQQQQLEAQQVMAANALDQKMTETKLKYDNLDSQLRQALINGDVEQKLKLEQLKANIFQDYEQMKAAKRSGDLQMIGQFIGAAGTVGAGVAMGSK